jgi:hypothetical protein
MRIGRNFEGADHFLLQGTVPVFNWRLRKLTKTTSLECYHYTNLLSNLLGLWAQMDTEWVIMIMFWIVKVTKVTFETILKYKPIVSM